MWAFAQWSHALAAALFGAIAIWQARRDTRDVLNRALVAMLFAVSLAALIAAMSGPASAATFAFIHARDLAALGFMATLWRKGREAGTAMTVGILYGVVGLLSLLMVLASFVPSLLVPLSDHDPAFAVFTLIGALTVVGALVLVHNLYTAAHPDARDALRLPLLGLAAMWLYDLNLLTSTWLAHNWPEELLAMRGAALVLIAPVFAISVQRNRPWKLRLSHSMAFQSASLVAIGTYLAATLIVVAALELVGGEVGRLAQTAFVFASSLAALLLVPSAKFRAWARVKVSKHFFQHRYDYRSEWLRFTDTLGRPEGECDPIQMRVVQAIADMTESPAGLLLTLDEAHALIVQAHWNWPLAEPATSGRSHALTDHLVRSERVIDLDALRDGNLHDTEESALIPAWILAEPQAWAMVPLLHFGELAGIVVLARPQIGRTLDWEDYDLLRVAGRQIASYLAEARGQEALSDARRFDEFNRRFAFIMHDIKNLVSQLSLLTRNAERHAANPEFRADMIATLQNSTARMNDLLARLSQHNKAKPEEARMTSLVFIAERVAATRRPQHGIVVSIIDDLATLAEPARLEQALGHLVQNAIDASPANEPVTMRITRDGEDALIDVIDRGCGMSAAFINAKLFRPFSSTKEGGFGIGTFEARSIVAAMGGRINVESHEGRGTVFSVRLPLRIAEQDRTVEALAA